ncbi:hypothetical protein [Virgibacillus sp. JSM 102003]|uniref:hypothetical protein n=1 Tax=Virgibacillus sp. JSM 102003 TaxID=1562108 RepID=UPI0035BFFEAC
MRYFTIAIIFMLLLLTSCSQEDEAGEKSDAVIKEAELTKFERQFVDITDYKTIAFDIDIHNKDVKELQTKVDYYENGKHKSQVTKSITRISDKEQKGVVRTLFLRRPKDENQEQWITSVITKNGYTTAKATNEIKDREKLDSSGWGGISSPTNIEIGEEKIIATIVHTAENELTIYENIETKEDLKRATDYEQVYLISARLN